MKHYKLLIKSHTDYPDYEDGIMAENLEDAIKRFRETLDFELTDQEWAGYVEEDKISLT